MNTFVSAMSENNTGVTTWNGAVSLGTSTDALVDLLFRTVRGLSKDRLFKHLEAAWNESPVATLRLIFYVRDCRGGKGERDLFYWAMEWLAREHGHTFAKNVALIPEYGYWKDIPKIVELVGVDSNAGRTLIQLHIDQLRVDMQGALAGNSITLAGKYAPTESGHYDKLARVYANVLSSDNFSSARVGRHLGNYRKGLSKLRKHANVVERLACANDWSSINYAQVPSKAMFRFRKAFGNHDQARFGEYIQSVQKGDKEIKAGQLFPHELVTKLYRGRDEVLEVQLQALIDGIAKLGTLSNTISVVDTSGSMDSLWGCSDKGAVKPIWPALALGLVTSEVAAQPFRNHMITFSARPTFHKIEGNSFHDKLVNMNRAHWSGNTDFVAVFSRVLERGQRYNVAPEDMPKQILVFSDMQFDSCGGRNTNYETIRKMYASTPYDVPKLVFWNLNGTTVDFPVSANQSDTALISGFSASILQLFMETGEFTPSTLVKSIVNAPRYSALTV